MKLTRLLGKVVSASVDAAVARAMGLGCRTPDSAAWDCLAILWPSGSLLAAEAAPCNSCSLLVCLFSGVQHLAWEATTRPLQYQHSSIGSFP